MAGLYCEQHGREHEVMTFAHQHNYRISGESVLVTKGMLKGGPWLCDRCCATLDRGDLAYLFHPFTASESGQMEGYDLAFERAYFAVTGTEVHVYGRRWPGTDAEGRIAMPACTSQKSARREPLCALDLLGDAE